MKKFLFSLSFIISIQCFALGDKPLIFAVVDMDKNTILAEGNIHKPHSMASLTKLMTAYVLINHHPDLDACTAKITEEERDLLKKTKTKIEKNENISCKKLLEAMLIVSDNWAANALSKSIPNVSQQKFVQMMNFQAYEWAMKDTLYKDPSGLSPDNISSAYDLSILMSHVVKEKLITQLSSEKEMVMVETTGGFLFFRNSNRLIREMHYKAMLSKTGFINESGYNLIFINQDKCNDKQVGIIIMGAKTSYKRASFAQSLLNKFSCSSIIQTKPIEKTPYKQGENIEKTVQVKHSTKSDS